MKVSVILAKKGSSEVATISPGQTVRTAVATLASGGFGALVVSPGDGEIAGILSERDIVRRLNSSGEGVLEATAESLMTTNVKTCSGEETAFDVLGRMSEGRFRHMPVVDGGGRMIGILSIGDVVKARLEEIEAENAAMADMLSH